MWKREARPMPVEGSREDEIHVKDFNQEINTKRDVINQNAEFSTINHTAPPTPLTISFPTRLLPPLSPS